MQLAPLHNGYVMPEEYFTECHVVIEHLDVMIRMLGRVVTHSRVCQIGHMDHTGCHMDHTGCHPLAVLAIRPTRAVTPGCVRLVTLTLAHTPA
jgi:hypothetical protein